MTKKQLSRRVKNRYFICQVEIGPYFGTERRRYAAWVANLPQGRRMSVVQKITRPNQLANEKYNPILAKKILSPNARIYAQEDGYKWLVRFAENALFRVVNEELARISRPLVKICGAGFPNQDSCWEPFDLGNAAETMGAWREQVLFALASNGVADRSAILAEFEAIYRSKKKPKAQEEQGDES